MGVSRGTVPINPSNINPSHTTTHVTFTSTTLLALPSQHRTDIVTIAPVISDPAVHTFFSSLHNLSMGKTQTGQRNTIPQLTQVDRIAYIITIFLLVSSAQGKPISQGQLQRRDQYLNSDDAVGVCGLVTTVIGVLITAIGVFRWRFWKGKQVRCCPFSTPH